MPDAPASPARRPRETGPPGPPRPGRASTPPRAAREVPVHLLARWALVAYCAFVVYGSLFPFDFTAAPEAIQRSRDRALFQLFDASGRRLFSIPDVVSNVLLGAPVGLLVVVGGLGGRHAVARIALAVILDAGFAAAVEVAQLLTPSRTASTLDVAAQVVGAAGAAVAAALAQAVLRRPWGVTLARGVWDRPPVAIALGLAALLAADAFYPFAITLDVSTAMDNLRAARLRPLGSLARGFWPDLLVEKAAVGAALGAACRLALAPWLGRAAVIGAWALCVALAGALEVGKLGFVGRSPNVDNALFVGAGALAGAVAIPWREHPALRARAAGLLVLVAAAALVYQELTPFDFTWSTHWARAKSARIEWLLFGSYYGAEAHSALFDLGKKLGLGAFLGASMRAAGRRGACGWGLALGVALEALQLFQRSHIPALTDALSIGAGAGLGAWALSRYRARTGAGQGGAVRIPDAV